MEPDRTQKGIRIADFGGMITDADPRDLARNQLQMLENVVIEQHGMVRSRRGMTIRHDVPATYELTVTKRSHAIFRIAHWNWLVFDCGAAFRVMDASGATEVFQTFTPSPAWHSEPKICFTQTSGGELFAVNGLDRPWKYNGQNGTAVNGEGPACAVGIDPPTAALAATTPGSGNALEGTYYVAYRWLDRFGNPSVLSPLLAVTATAGDKFEYSTVANSSGKDSTPRITQKQIFRSLVNDAETLYLVTTIADNSTTTYTGDTLSDEALAANAALPILNDDESLNANRFVVPPTHKRIVVWHQDRLWFMADGTYRTGTVATTNTSATFTGTNTVFTDEMIGWELWLTSSTKIPYTITAVASSTSITVSPAADATASGLLYILRPARSERNKIYYSEAEEPEAVPQSQNEVLIQISRVDDDDEIVGGYSFGADLYVAKERATYVVSSVRQPNLDAGVSMAFSRGLFNHWCSAHAEGMQFCMDRLGMYVTSGGKPEPIGEVFQNYWREQLIDFSVSEYFFVAVNQVTRTARFYVVLSGSGLSYPGFVFCYNYILNRWWTETRPWSVTGAGTIRNVGARETYYELPAGFPPVYDDGYATDGVIAATTGVLSSYNTETSDLTATTAVFTSAMVGAPIVFTSGNGRQQLGIINAFTSSTVVVIYGDIHVPNEPAAGDTFVVGGIPWRLKTAMFDIPAIGARAPIDVTASFVPTAAAGNLLEVRHYLGHSSTPENAEIDIISEGETCGAVKGSPNSTISMYVDKVAEAPNNGVARKSIGMSTSQSVPSYRNLTVELRGIAAGERHRITQLDIDGVL